MQTLTVRLLDRSPIPHARWCEPVGWEPANKIAGAEYGYGAWWGAGGQVAGLVWFGHAEDHEELRQIEAHPVELAVVSCGDGCDENYRVIEWVAPPAAD
jgi:hypothetical protein